MAGPTADGVRTVGRIIPAERQVEGDGFVVRRPFPSASSALSHLDPFLLWDQMGPVEHGPGEAIGTPWHPHRGFETVTYLLEGHLEHRDSLGNHGDLGAGDTQWMTAGAGVLHKEGPSDAFLRHGGRLHGLQLWVNLPRAAKMTPPRYQDIRAHEVAVVELAGGAVARVIAGELFGVTGPGMTHTPITDAHITLPPGVEVSTPVPAGHTALVYPLTGTIEVAGTELPEAHLAVLGPGDRVELRGAGAAPAEVMLVTGEPIGEPVARQGPFVMNNRAEIAQAIEDFNAGRFGTVPADG